MTERELLVKVTVTQDNMQSDIAQLKTHSDANNGIIADLVSAKHFTFGALAMLGFLMTAGVPLVALVWNRL